MSSEYEEFTAFNASEYLERLNEAERERDVLKNIIAELLPCGRFALAKGLAGVKIDVVSRSEAAIEGREP